jgi:hypothetical protein
VEHASLQHTERDHRARGGTQSVSDNSGSCVQAPVRSPIMSYFGDSGKMFGVRYESKRRRPYVTRASRCRREVEMAVKLAWHVGCGN